MNSALVFNTIIVIAPVSYQSGLIKPRLFHVLNILLKSNCLSILYHKNSIFFFFQAAWKCMSGVEGCFSLLVAFLKELCYFWDKPLKFKFCNSHLRMCLSSALSSTPGFQNILISDQGDLSYQLQPFPKDHQCCCSSSCSGLDRSCIWILEQRTIYFLLQGLVECFASCVILVWAHFLIFCFRVWLELVEPSALRELRL